MQLQPMMGLLLCVSAVSLGVVVYSTTEFEVEAQDLLSMCKPKHLLLLFNPKKNCPIFKPNNVSLMFLVPTPNEVVAQMLALAK